MRYLAIVLFCCSVGHCLNPIRGQAQERDRLDSLTGRFVDGMLADTVLHQKQQRVAKKASFKGYPYLFYTPETELAFGAGGIFIFYGGRGKNLLPSKIGFGGYYSTLKQYSFGLNNKFYFLNNDLYIELPINYSLIVDKYWGQGDSTVTTGAEQYMRSNFATSLAVQIPPELFVADRTGIIFDFDYTGIVDKKENDFLRDGTTTGSEGGWFFGIGGDLVWDSRDNLFSPTKGGYQNFRVIVYPGLGDFTFALFELNLKYFASFRSGSVFGFNFFMSGLSGDPPFYKLPALGGPHHMRGYFQGRYRDDFYATMQVEYRQNLVGRLGFVLFFGVGNVSDELLTYDFGAMKRSWGGGLRFLFNRREKINLRMDIGFGEDGNRGIYFGIEEAF